MAQAAENMGNNGSDNNSDDNRDISDDEIFLVDGSGYIFRAYFALPQNLTNPEGQPIGAVLGFTNMLQKMLIDLQAPYIAVIFDAAKENFRNEIYGEYKANRPPAPDDLIPQFPMFREATEAFGVPAIELEGYEADDLIATYTKLAKAQGRKVTIVGVDKDLMQLVDEDVRLYDPIKNKYLYAADVKEKFGVLPDRVIDVQALAGDSTDNIPGVLGIGVKTAAQLIDEYGSLEELLERAGEIKQPKRREKLTDHAEDARMSKKLVTLAKDAPVPLAIEDLKAHELNTETLIPFLQRQGFKAALSRLGQKSDIPQAEIEQAKDNIEAGNDNTDFPPVEKNEYTLIQDTETLKDWINAAYETGLLAFDTETTGLTPAKAELVGISLSHTLGKAAYIPLAHVSGDADLFGDGGGAIRQIPFDEAVKLLKPLLEDESVLKIGHNMKYDWQMLAKHGVHIAPCDDTMLLSYVLDGTSHKHGMDALSEEFCGHTPIKFAEVAGKGKNMVTFDKVPLDKALDYAAEDAEITLRLHHIFKPRLAREHMVTVYEDIERPLIPIIGQMELHGVKVDREKLHSLSSEFGKKLVTLEKEIFKLAGHEFNIASPKQMGVVLFDEMGLDGGKKTKGGDWSTSVDVLEKLADQGHEIAKKILEWRQLAKLKSTYTDALQEEINKDTGRIHTSYHMTGTTTGRLASSDPNLQNIPIRTEEGRKIREAFIPEDGHVLLSVDYSQVELRLTAALAGVEALKKAFKDGVDIHSLTASQVFDVPLDEVTPEIRRQAKAVNFGIIYGISGWGLAKQLGCEPGEANDFIRRYLAKFNEIQDFMESKKEEARKHGFVRTLYGRKCTIANINSKMGNLRQGAERQAINAPLQGTAADIMKKAMIRMPAALEREGLGAKMLLQVHDELIFEVPEDELEQTAATVRNVMESVADIGVPLDADAGHGKNWNDAH